MYPVPPFLVVAFLFLFSRPVFSADFVVLLCVILLELVVGGFLCLLEEEGGRGGGGSPEVLT